MQGEAEVFFQCPYCWQNVSMVFETNYPKQEYIEDCEVCCNPILIFYDKEDDGTVIVNARSLND